MSSDCSVPREMVDGTDAEISAHSQLILPNSSLHKIRFPHIYSFHFSRLLL